MTRYPNRNSLAALAAAISLLPQLQSCGSNVEWSEVREIPSEGWNPLNAVEFALQPEDSLIWLSGEQSQNVMLNIRYNDRCGLAVLPIAVESESLSGVPHTDTISVRLFNADGTPASHGSDRNQNVGVLKGKIGNPIAEILNTDSRPVSLGIYDVNVEVSSGIPVGEMARYTFTSLADSTTDGITHLTLLISR